METKYGIISDIHTLQPEEAGYLLSYLVALGAGKLVLNGDIVGDYSGVPTAEYLARILEFAGKTSLETYVLPGSHETADGVEEVMGALSPVYQNLIYTVETPKLEFSDHHIVFLPGSDFRPGEAVYRGYALESGTPSGRYKSRNSVLHVTDMNDLRKLVTQPEKTVVFCHIPARFGNLGTCVDMAHFYEGRGYFRKTPDELDYTPWGIYPATVDKKLIETQNSTVVYDISVSDSEIKDSVKVLMELWNVDRYLFFVERKANSGNPELRKLYDEIGIEKAVSGHFHESCWRANDRKGSHVKEGEPVEELFWMASHADMGRLGILTVSGEKVSYENVEVEK